MIFNSNWLRPLYLSSLTFSTTSLSLLNSDEWQQAFLVSGQKDVELGISEVWNEWHVPVFVSYFHE